MPIAERIPVAVLARDESKLIERTLASIHNQEGDDRYHFAVTVASNACTDDTAERAQAAIDSFDRRPDISYHVEEIDEPGKNHAINVVLANSASDDRSPKFICGDGDAAFSSNCFWRIAETLDQPDVWVTGPVSRKIIHPSIVGTPLGDIQRARQLEVEYSGTIPAPVGGLLGFRRDLVELNQLPHNALSEDRYLTLTATRKYGRSAVKTILDASVFTNAARTMEDFKQVGDRIATVRKMLIKAYPDLGNLLRELTDEASRRGPPPEEVRQRVISQLTEEGINPDRLDEWHRLKASARPRSDLIRPDGTWAPTASTKFL